MGGCVGIHPIALEHNPRPAWAGRERQLRNTKPPPTPPPSTFLLPLLPLPLSVQFLTLLPHRPISPPPKHSTRRGEFYCPFPLSPTRPASPLRPPVSEPAAEGGQKVVLPIRTAKASAAFCHCPRTTARPRAENRLTGSAIFLPPSSTSSFPPPAILLHLFSAVLQIAGLLTVLELSSPLVS